MKRIEKCLANCSRSELGEILKTAVEAALKGGKILRNLYGKPHQIKHKGDIDLVTEADISSEKAILAILNMAHPGIKVLAEESYSLYHQAPDGPVWIVDPLDGTTNFAHQLPFFAVSIAYVHKGTPIVGVVLSPETGELFTAMKGKGAELNGQEIHVSESKNISESLLATGFPYDLKLHMVPIMKRMERCLSASRGVRRYGAAALDLCYLACGRFDGFWEQHLKPWDTAAGELIAREAGATVTNFSNDPFTINDDEILATNGHIHSQMISLMELE